MNSFVLGSVVISTQGHDCGQYYVVVEVGQKSVEVCDGEFKKLKNPKRKNPAHLRVTPYVDSDVATKLSSGLKINDQMIYHAIIKVKKVVKEEDLYGKR